MTGSRNLSNQIVDGNCQEDTCHYAVTNWYPSRHEFDFATKQLQSNPDREWQIKKNRKGDYALFTKFKSFEQKSLYKKPSEENKTI